MEFVDKVEALKARMKPKVLKLLDILRKLSMKEGFQCSEVVDMSCDTYTWVMHVFTKKVKKPEIGTWVEGTVGLTLTIESSMTHDGDESGINFELKAESHEGEQWRCAPYNWTSNVWVSVDDEAAVDARWGEFLSLVINGFDPSNPAVCLLV